MGDLLLFEHLLILGLEFIMCILVNSIFRGFIGQGPEITQKTITKIHGINIKQPHLRITGSLSYLTLLRLSILIFF